MSFIVFLLVSVHQVFLQTMISPKLPLSHATSTRVPVLLAAMIMSLYGMMSLSSCTQTVVNAEIPFSEQLVVSCFVYGDSSAITVDVTKTMPVTSKYSRDSALVRDAEVWMQTPGGKIKLAFDNRTGQYRCPVSSITEGGTYTLTVSWNGRTVVGSTVVPAMPVLDSLRQSGAYFKPNAAVAYGAVDERFSFNRPDTSVTTLKPESDKGLPKFRHLISGKQTDTGVVMRDYDFEPLFYSDSVVYLSTKFVALDGPYYTFYLSYQVSGAISFLGSFGTNPAFTMKGDGIGIITGVSKATPCQVLRAVRP